MAKKSVSKQKAPEKGEGKVAVKGKSKGKTGAVLASAGALLSVVVSVTVVGLNLSKILENSRKGFLSREKLVIRLNRDSTIYLPAYHEFELAKYRDEINRKSIFLFEVENQGASHDTVIVGVELPLGYFVGGFGVINAFQGVELDSLPYLQKKKEDTRVASTRILRFPNGGKVLAAVWSTDKEIEGTCKIWTRPAAWEGTYEFEIHTPEDTNP